MRLFPATRRSGRAKDWAEAGVGGGFLALAIALCGASAAGITANAIVQVAAVIALIAIMMRGGPMQMSRAERHLLILIGLFSALFLVQLIPLPPGLWTLLPGRAPVVTGFDTLGISRGWMPVSLAPALTVRSGLALLPPLAIVIIVLCFRRLTARLCASVVVGMTVLSLLLGVAQFSGGGAYLYANSNLGSATGFFANSNHFATLMCIAMPLSAGLLERWRGAVDGNAGASRIVATVVWLGIALICLLGITMTKSFAGLLLSVLAIVGGASILLASLSKSLRFSFVAGIAGILAIAGLILFTGMAGDFGLAGLESGAMSRPWIWNVTLRAIAAFVPFGSGFGSFQQVFHLFEDTANVGPTFANHAHDDLFEFLLEGGLGALLLLGLFLAWFGQRAIHIWLKDRRRDPLAQGAVVAVLIVLLHSLVDYPLRTGAIATVFAFCLALMAREQASSTEEAPAEAAPAARHVSA